MLKSFGRFWQNYAEFKPRTRRRDYWKAVLCNLIINIILGALYIVVPIFKYVAVAYAIVTLCPCLAINVRRLHDTGKSGKLLFLLLIPVVGWIIVFIKLVSDSEKEENKYGAGDKYPPQAKNEVEEIHAGAEQMYIPPIYNTDKPEEASEKEEQEPVEVAQEQPEIPEQVVAEPENNGYAAQEQAAQVNDDVAENGEQQTKPKAIEDIIAQYIVSEDEAQPSYTAEKLIFEPVAEPVSDDEPSVPVYQPVSESAAATGNYPERPSYSGNQTAAQPSGNTPVQKVPARPKGYRSRTFPYGH